MRLLLQRVSRAEVRIRDDSGSSRVSGKIDRGFVLLVGFTTTDDDAKVAWMAEKVSGLRIFADAEDKMNLALADVSGSVLVVSQFTLYGDVQKGNRPSFTGAAVPEKGEMLYLQFCKELEHLLGTQRIARGKFRAMMDVELSNEGPVTIWIDTDVHK